MTLQGSGVHHSEFYEAILESEHFQISLSSIVSKKMCFCSSLEVAIKIEIAHKHMRMLDVN
jgi:hypothetical protein